MRCGGVNISRTGDEEKHIGTQFGNRADRNIKFLREKDGDWREYRTVDTGENTVDQEKEENAVFFESRPIEWIVGRIRRLRCKNSLSVRSVFQMRSHLVIGDIIEKLNRAGNDKLRRFKYTETHG